MIQCDVRIFLSNGLVKNHQKPIQWLAVSSWFSVCNPVVSLARWWFHIIFLFSLLVGEDEPKLTSIFFQMGWFNHQLAREIFGTGSQAEKLNYLRDASKACEEAVEVSMFRPEVFFCQKILEEQIPAESRRVSWCNIFSSRIKERCVHYYIFS